MSAHPYYPTAFAPGPDRDAHDWFDVCYSCGLTLNDTGAEHDRLGSGVSRLPLSGNPVKRWLNAHQLLMEDTIVAEDALVPA